MADGLDILIVFLAKLSSTPYPYPVDYHTHFGVLFILSIFSGKSEGSGNWSHLFANMQADPEKFYTLIEQSLKERQIPCFNTSQITLKEGSILSHTRVYLEVSRWDYIFHICAAPWGNAFSYPGG